MSVDVRQVCTFTFVYALSSVQNVVDLSAVYRVYGDTVEIPRSFCAGEEELSKGGKLFRPQRYRLPLALLLLLLLVDGRRDGGWRWDTPFCRCFFG